MLNHIRKCIVPALTFASLFICSCQPDTIEIPKEELYTRNFVKQFGVFNTEQDWNSAGRIKAEVDPSLLSGAERINVYTDWPGNKSCRIVATYPASEQAFEFDYPKENELAYVIITGHNGKTIHASYSRITDNRMFVGDRASRAGIKAPLPYPFDLTENKALGSLPVTSANEAFWRSFTGKDGNPINITDPVTTSPTHTEYSEITLYRWVGDNTFNDDNNIIDKTKGNDLGGWNEGLVTKQYSFPNDITSNVVNIKFTLTLTGNEPTIKIGKKEWDEIALDGLTDYCNTNGIQINDKFQYVMNVTGSNVDYLKNSDFVRIQGNHLTVHSAEFKEGTPQQSASTVNLSDIFDLYGLTTSPQSTFDGFKHSYLGPNNTYDEIGFSCGDLAPIVGKGGVFSEEINDKGGRITCNLEEFYEKLRPQDGVDYIISEDNSEVSIDYFFGCASTFNSFGYFYYTDDDANIADESERMKVLLKRPMFLLMYNACPGANILLKEQEDGEWKFDSGLNYPGIDIVPDGENEGKDQGDEWEHCMRFSKFVEDAEAGKYDGQYIPRMRSANYRLVYYDDTQFEGGKLKNNAVGKYGFPKGTHIAFFVIQGGQYALDKNGDAGFKLGHRHIAFSRPVMNRYIGNTIKDGHSHSTGKPSVMNTGTGQSFGWTAFVTYAWNGQIIMGVEDYFAETENGINGSDHDMNDMLFRVNGEFERTRDELNEDPVKKQSWVIACEDLGGTYDYDFNDVVFGVSHVAGETTATVTALASGGTLPVYLQSDYPQIVDNAEVTHANGILIPAGSADGEFHSWWGANRPNSTIINASRWESEGATVEIKVPEDFSLTTHSDTHAKPGDGESSMGGFRVIVKKPGEEDNTIITAPNKDNSYTAPQMFLVPNTWLWPVESQPINEVYSGFINWTSRWWTNMENGMSGRVIHHYWEPVYKESKNR